MAISRRDMLKLGAATAVCAAGGPLLPRPVRADGDVSQFFLLPDEDMSVPPVLHDAAGSIVENGLIRAGLFKAPFGNMNLLESDAIDGRAKNWLGLPRLMEWVGVGMAHAHWYFGAIIVNAHSAGLAALYGFDRRTGEYFSHDSFGSLKRVQVADSMWDDVTYYRKRGFKMEVAHKLNRGLHEARFEIKGSCGKPGVSAEMLWHEDLGRVQPLVRMTPLGERDFIFNHKAQMPIEGMVKIGDEEIEFLPGRDVANMDEVRSFSTSGFKIDYNWFNFGGFCEGGRLVGLNVFSSSQREGVRWTENCIWAGDRLSLLGPVRFEMNLYNTMKPWHAVEENGRVDVTFFPEGCKSIDLGVLGRYVQMCGRFRGLLVDDGGERHEVKDYYGCAEYADIL